MVKKLIIPLFYISEWVLFFYVLLSVFLFNMIYFVNIVFIDMPWEEPITLTSSLIKSLLLVFGMGTLCFIYIKFLKGNRVYRKVKEVIWGILFGINTLSCIILLSVSYSFKLSNEERLVVITALLVSAVITIKIIKKFRNETK